MWHSNERCIRNLYNLVHNKLGHISGIFKHFINHNYITYCLFVSVFLTLSLTLSITALIYFCSVFVGFQPKYFQTSCSHEETPASSVLLWGYTPVCLNHFWTQINSSHILTETLAEILSVDWCSVLFVLRWAVCVLWALEQWDWEDSDHSSCLKTHQATLCRYADLLSVLTQKHLENEKVDQTFPVY